jgi:RNA polymerase sigma-70 factor (ECF subfamily)
VSASCKPSSSRIPDDDDDGFARFFDDALPVVFGYVLRLCGGDRDEAWDVTQDAWLTFVREVNRDPGELPSIAWLVRVARSRFLDRWRRTHKLSDRLRLVWAVDRGNDTTDVEHDVLPCLARLQPAHRIVLTLFYIDDLPVAEVGRLMGLSRSGTYSVLGRARDELRTKLVEVSDV